MSIDVNKISRLGFGLMRLPESDGQIDLKTVCEMVDSYLDKGFNYFDTAYIYHSGNSEKVVKEAITKRHPRNKFMLATKLPAWEIRCEADVDRIFNDQLEKTGADYFDFYLLHSVEEGNNYDTYVKYDCFKWGVQKKEQGLIKHFGFSFHGSPKLLTQILDEHPEVEFVQIQLNYADWDNPIVRSGELYNILHSRNIPMIIMEPIKGGSLANPSDSIKSLFAEVSPSETPASMALRFVASLPGVMTILSGMSTPEQMNQNLETFADFKPLSEAEKIAIDKAVAIMKSIDLIGCTGCRYCVDGCPKKIPIPDVFRAINTMTLYKENFRPRAFYNGITEKTGKAKDCIKCGQCEGVCPQHLKITELLADASAKLDKPFEG